jgi:uncharacterized protein DUF6916
MADTCEEGTPARARRRMSRGTFIKATGAIAIGGAILPLETGLAAASSLPPSAAEGLIDHAYLSARVGQVFLVRSGAVTGLLRLASVSTETRRMLPKGAPSLYRATSSFQATFVATGQAPLSQGTFTFQDRTAFKFPLFILPAGKAGLVQTYRADFCQLSA